MKTLGSCKPGGPESGWNASRCSGALDLHSSVMVRPESVEITDMCTDGGEELVFRELDQGIPRQGGSRPYGRSHGGGLWTEDHEK